MTSENGRKALGPRLFTSSLADPQPEDENEVTTQMIENSKIVIFDNMYDLTLVVGTQESPDGVATFRINRSALRMLSSAFRAMLCGKFKESLKSEIHLPEDNPNAFHTVLQLCHQKFEDLPNIMSHEELLEVATLCDKYDLSKVVRSFVAWKSWVDPHRGKTATWPLSVDPGDWLFITHVFNLQRDYDYFANLIAMTATVDEDGRLCYMHKGQQMRKAEKMALSEDLPDQILDKVRHLRRAALQDILNITIAAVARVAKRKKCTRGKSRNCAATRLGYLMMCYGDLGLFPTPANADHMPNSVVIYSKGLGNLQRNERSYRPATTTFEEFATSKCDWHACMGDFYIEEGLESILKKHMHPQVWPHRNEVSISRLNFRSTAKDVREKLR